MNHLLDIFKPRSIVRAYADCRTGYNKHFLTAFRLELDSLLDRVAAESNIYKETDKELHSFGYELLEVLIAVANAIPIEAPLEVARMDDIHDKLDDAYTKTRAMLNGSVRRSRSNNANGSV